MTANTLRPEATAKGREFRNFLGIILAARNARDQDEKFDSPRNGLPCFHPDGLKEPINAASRADWGE